MRFIYLGVRFIYLAEYLQHGDCRIDDALMTRRENPLLIARHNESTTKFVANAFSNRFYRFVVAALLLITKNIYIFLLGYDTV